MINSYLNPQTSCTLLNPIRINPWDTMATS